MIAEKTKLLKSLRKKLSAGRASTGSWLQIPDANIAEILSDAGYDWITIDCEHGIFNPQSLVDICRAIELHGSLPFVRLPDWQKASCKLALEAGAAGVIIPMVESANDIKLAIENCKWPPNGARGIGFSRSNLFGKYFEMNRDIAEDPFTVPMIENKNAVEEIDKILSIKGVDAIFVGPYDLSASLGCIGDFEAPIFCEALSHILETAKKFNVPAGIHVVAPDADELSARIKDGFRFNAFSIDAVFLREACVMPTI